MKLLRDPWPTTAQQAYRAARAQERRTRWADREVAKLEARWVANRRAYRLKKGMTPEQIDEVL